jgi:hypothetical protein
LPSDAGDVVGDAEGVPDAGGWMVADSGWVACGFIRAMTLVLGLALVLVVAVFILFDGFEGELDLVVESGKVGFELFELVFLFPRFFDYFLKDGDVLGNLFHFFLVFLQKRGNGFEGAEEHLGGNVGVFCQSAALEVVQDVAFATDEEAVFDEVEAVFHAGFGLYLDGVVDNIDFVVGKEFGYLVAFSYATAVALLQIFGRPGNVELVDGDAPALGVDLLQGKGLARVYTEIFRQF